MKYLGLSFPQYVKEVYNELILSAVKQWNTFVKRCKKKFHDSMVIFKVNNVLFRFFFLFFTAKTFPARLVTVCIKIAPQIGSINHFGIGLPVLYL